MALTTLAAGLELRAVDRATPGLRKVGQGLELTGKKARSANRSMFLAGAAASALGIGALAVGRGIFRAGGDVADFEQQISAVRSVLRKPSGAPQLEREIKKLGATTVFTATEAGKGAELLARAGFNERESIAALGDTLNLAAADNLQLAAATSITTSTLRAFRLDADQTQMVVDTLAQTSSKSNTNVTQLGEALKFAAPFAKGMGVGLADTNIALGLLANMGLRGTVGGTALKNMFIKLAAPADKAKAAMKKAGFSMVKTSDGSLNMIATIKKLSGVFDKMKGPVDRVAFAQTVFGIRGGTAAINLTGAYKKMSSQVDGSTNKFDKFVKQIREADGAAKQMAEIRLNNLRGALTLLNSALEGLKIEIFEGRFPAAAKGVRRLADAISVVVITMQNAEAVSRGEMVPALEELSKKFSDDSFRSLMQFALGMLDGLKVIDRMITGLGRLAEMVFGFADGQERIARGFGQLLVVGTPALVLFGLLAGAAGAMIIPFVFAGVSILAALKAVAIGVAVAAGAVVLFLGFIQATRTEGQSFSERLLELGAQILAFFEDLSKRPFAQIFKEIFGLIIDNVITMVDVFAPAFETIGALFGQGTEGGAGFLETLAQIVLGFLIISNVVVKILAFVVKFFVENFIMPFLTGFLKIGEGLFGLISGSMTFGEAMESIFKGLAGIIINFFIAPLRAGLALIVKAGEAGGISEKRLAGAKAILAEAQFKPGTTLGLRDPRKDPKVKARLDEQKNTLTKWREQLEKSKKALVEGNKSDVSVTMPELVNKLDIDNKMCVDGKNLNVASAKHQKTLTERTGGVAHPFLDSQVIANGSPLAGGQ